MKHLQGLEFSMRECIPSFESSFGPFGKDQLIISNAKSILITNSGSSILKTIDLRCDSGVFVKRVLESSNASLGDGTSSLFILLHSIIKQINHQQTINHFKLSKAILVLQANFFSSYSPTQCFQLDENNVWYWLKNCIHTMIDGKFSSTVADHLTDYIYAYLRLNVCWYDKSCRMSSIFPVLCAVLKDIDNNVLLCEGRGVSRSILLATDSMVICRKVYDLEFESHLNRSSLRAMRGHSSIRFNGNNGMLPFVVLRCELVPSSGEVQVSSELLLQRSMAFSSHSIEKLMHYLRGLGVKLVLSTEKLLDPVSELCLKHGMLGVQCISQQQATDLCCRCGIQAVNSLGELHQYSRYIGFCKNAEEIMLSSKRMIQLSGLKLHQSSGSPIITSQLMLCGESTGLLQQYRDTAVRCLKLLRCWSSDCFRVVPAGGSFELYLVDELQQLRKTDGDATMQMALDILSEAALSIPSLLIQNSGSKSRVCDVLLSIKQYLSTVSQHIPGQIYGLSYAKNWLEYKDSPCIHLTKYNASVTQDEGRVACEPLGLKLRMFNTLLSLVAQLLRVDDVIQVKACIKQDDQCTNTDESDGE